MLNSLKGNEHYVDSVFKLVSENPDGFLDASPRLQVEGVQLPSPGFLDEDLDTELYCTSPLPTSGDTSVLTPCHGSLPLFHPSYPLHQASRSAIANESVHEPLLTFKKQQKTQEESGAPSCTLDTFTNLPTDVNTTDFESTSHFLDDELGSADAFSDHQSLELDQHVSFLEHTPPLPHESSPAYISVVRSSGQIHDPPRPLCVSRYARVTTLSCVIPSPVSPKKNVPNVIRSCFSLPPHPQFRTAPCSRNVNAFGSCVSSEDFLSSNSHDPGGVHTELQDDKNIDSQTYTRTFSDTCRQFSPGRHGAGTRSADVRLCNLQLIGSYPSVHLSTESKHIFTQYPQTLTRQLVENPQMSKELKQTVTQSLNATCKSTHHVELRNLCLEKTVLGHGTRRPAFNGERNATEQPRPVNFSYEGNPCKHHALSADNANNEDRIKTIVGPSGMGLHSPHHDLRVVKVKIPPLLSHSGFYPIDLTRIEPSIQAPAPLPAGNSRLRKLLFKKRPSWMSLGKRLVPTPPVIPSCLDMDYPCDTEPSISEALGHDSESRKPDLHEQQVGSKGSRGTSDTVQSTPCAPQYAKHDDYSVGTRSSKEYHTPPHRRNRKTNLSTTSMSSTHYKDTAERHWVEPACEEQHSRTRNNPQSDANGEGAMLFSALDVQMVIGQRDLVTSQSPKERESVREESGVLNVGMSLPPKSTETTISSKACVVNRANTHESRRTSGVCERGSTSPEILATPRPIPRAMGEKLMPSLLVEPSLPMGQETVQLFSDSVPLSRSKHDALEMPSVTRQGATSACAIHVHSSNQAVEKKQEKPPQKVLRSSIKSFGCQADIGLDMTTQRERSTKRRLRAKKKEIVPAGKRITSKTTKSYDAPLIYFPLNNLPQEYVHRTRYSLEKAAQKAFSTRSPAELSSGPCAQGDAASSPRALSLCTIRGRPKRVRQRPLRWWLLEHVEYVRPMGSECPVPVGVHRRLQERNTTLVKTANAQDNRLRLTASRPKILLHSPQKQRLLNDCQPQLSKKPSQHKDSSTLVMLPSVRRSHTTITVTDTQRAGSANKMNDKKISYASADKEKYNDSVESSIDSRSKLQKKDPSNATPSDNANGVQIVEYENLDFVKIDSKFDSFHVAIVLETSLYSVCELMLSPGRSKGVDVTVSTLLGHVVMVEDNIESSEDCSDPCSGRCLLQVGARACSLSLTSAWGMAKAAWNPKKGITSKGKKRTKRSGGSSLASESAHFSSDFFIQSLSEDNQGSCSSSHVTHFCLLLSRGHHFHIPSGTQYNFTNLSKTHPLVLSLTVCRVSS